MTITKEARDELARLEEILAGRRRGEYVITNEVTFACGNWLMDHSQEVLSLIDGQPEETDA